MTRLQSPSYAITVRLKYADRPGMLGRITSAIGEAEGFIGAVDIVNVKQAAITRDITVSARDVAHGQQIVERVQKLDGVRVTKVSDRTFLLHLGGKIEVSSKVPVKTRDDLSMAYTPGVARVCRSIHRDPEASFALTIRRNTVAVVTDGTAVLGLGDIGPRAALPVMEGKALLFKEFAGVDAFPICLDTKDVSRIVDTVSYLAPTFGGINLEDISSPRCVEIERQLVERLEVPVFHDDQHGTAVVVLGALENALKVVGKQLGEIRVALNGPGAAGYAIARLLQSAGVRRIVACDRDGILHRGRAEQPGEENVVRRWFVEHTNPEQRTGSLRDAMRGADVFIGVSVGNVVDEDDLKGMAPEAIVFALANPEPEVEPELATRHARVVATGRSDYPNQINNVLCFPGFFRGLLDARALRVTEPMKVAASRAMAGVIAADELHPDYIVPSVFDRRVVKAVAASVSRAAIETGVARRQQKPGFQIV